MAITILIVDDNFAFRQSARAYLNIHPEFQVLADVCNGVDSLELAERLQPDVIVMDFAMFGSGKFDLTRKLLRHIPGARVIILSMYRESIYIQYALHSGAYGYVLKDETVEHLTEAIFAAAAGQHYFSPRIREAGELLLGVGARCTSSENL